MKQVSFSAFRRQASSLLDEVERGAVITILRHGKPVAEVAPPRSRPATAAWKRPGPRLVVSGASLARAILEERGAR